MGDEAQYMFHARAILLQLWGAEHGFFTETTLDLQFHLEAWLLWGMGGGTLSMRPRGEHWQRGQWSALQGVGRISASRKCAPEQDNRGAVW